MNTTLQVMYPILVCGWFLAHFITNRQSQKRQSWYSTKTFLDDAIPFIPDMILVYFSGFILANMAYIMLGSSEFFPRIAIGYGFQFVVSISLYAFFPCRIERYEDFIPNNLPSRLLSAFQRTSEPYNAFPSMHTSFCIFSALSVWVYRSHGIGFILILWAALVALSTLLVKQHSVVDVLAGAALGAVLYLFVFWAGLFL